MKINYIYSCARIVPMAYPIPLLDFEQKTLYLQEWMIESSVYKLIVNTLSHLLYK